MKKIISLLLLLLPLQIIAETLQFSGEITELAETGRGPEVWLRLTKAEDGSSLDFILSDENALKLKKNQWLTVTYEKVTKPLMIGLRLTSEPVNTRFSPDTPERYFESPQYTLVGDYVSGQLGDAGMYLQLKDRYQKIHDFVGLFELDADNMEKYQGQEIEVTYIKEQKINVTHYKNLSSETKSLDCMKKAMSQAEINRCSYEEYETADIELNTIYRQILATYSDDVEFIEKLKDAQRAWIAFRDAHLEALYPADDKRFAYGSMYINCYNTDLAALTRKRTTQLQQWLIGQEEGESCTSSIRIIE
jgi:uncharacterized protein YecT (DUF1311 family)